MSLIKNEIAWDAQKRRQECDDEKVYSRITIIILIIIIIIIIIAKSSLVIHILCICYEILMQHKGYNKFPISFKPSRCSMDILNIPPTHRWCNQLCGQLIFVHLQKIDWIRSRYYVQLYRFHCNLNSHVLNHLLIHRFNVQYFNHPFFDISNQFFPMLFDIKTIIKEDLESKYWPL